MLGFQRGEGKFGWYLLFVFLSSLCYIYMGEEEAGNSNRWQQMAAGSSNGWQQMAAGSSNGWQQMAAGLRCWGPG